MQVWISRLYFYGTNMSIAKTFELIFETKALNKRLSNCKYLQDIGG